MKRDNLAPYQVVKNQKTAELEGAKRDQAQICSEEKNSIRANFTLTIIKMAVEAETGSNQRGAEG